MKKEEEQEFDHVALTKAFDNLRSRCKAIADHHHSSSTRNDEMELRNKLLEQKESDLKARVESKEEELDYIQEAITQKLLEFEDGKTQLKSLNLLIDEKREELESKERDFDSKGESFKLLEKSMEDLMCRVELGEMKIVGLLEKLKLEEELLEPNGMELQDIADKVGLIISEAERKERELESKEIQIVSRERELELIEKRVGEKVSKAEFKERHFMVMEKSIEENRQRLDALVKLMEEREKNLVFVEEEVKRKEMRVEARVKELELIEMRVNEMGNKVKVKERELEQQAKEIEMKRGQLDSQLKIQQLDHTADAHNVIVASCGEADSSVAKDAFTILSPNLPANVTSEERNVPEFGNENLSGNSFVQNELAVSLQLVPDPARVVLNFIQKSLAQYLKNGYFEESVMSSNIALLKELIGVAPHVGAHLKVDATYLVAQWKTTMRGNTENSVESLAFVLFIATYGLIYMLTVDEIVKVLGLILQNQMTLDLCQTPAIASTIADLIRDLIERAQLPEAIIFICTFKLIDFFPLVPLLEKYMEDAMKWYEVICRSSTINPDERFKGVNNQMVKARALIQCMRGYILESKDSPKAIETQIDQLEKLEANWRLLAPSFHSNIGEQQELRKRKKPNNARSLSTLAPQFVPHQRPKVKFVFGGTKP